MTYAPNSSVPGYLGPSSTPFFPIEDAALDAYIEALISGITNINPNFVRARWQPTSPLQPPITQDWVAVGITEQDADTFAYTTRDPNTNAIVEIRQEDLTVQCSFYGPNARLNASILRDGLSIKQNQENLLLNRFGFNRCSSITNMSTQINQQWYQRREIVLYFKRLVAREYSVLDILSSSGNVNDGTTSSNYQTEAISS